MEYYSAIKKNKIPAFLAIWMDLEIIMLSEVRQWDTNIKCFHWHVESEKRTDWTSLQNRCWLTDSWSPEETVWGVGGCTWAVGWKSCEIGLLRTLYNYRCDKFIWVIKKREKNTWISNTHDKQWIQITPLLRLYY